MRDFVTRVNRLYRSVKDVLDDEKMSARAIAAEDEANEKIEEAVLEDNDNDLSDDKQD